MLPSREHLAAHDAPLCGADIELQIDAKLIPRKAAVHVRNELPLFLKGTAQTVRADQAGAFCAKGHACALFCKKKNAGQIVIACLQGINAGSESRIVGLADPVNGGQTACFRGARTARVDQRGKAAVCCTAYDSIPAELLFQRRGCPTQQGFGRRGAVPPLDMRQVQIKIGDMI